MPSVIQQNNLILIWSVHFGLVGSERMKKRNNRHRKEAFVGEYLVIMSVMRKIYISREAFVGVKKFASERRNIVNVALFTT